MLANVKIQFQLPMLDQANGGEEFNKWSIFSLNLVIIGVAETFNITEHKFI